jgi:hypothetical protein
MEPANRRAYKCPARIDSHRWVDEHGDCLYRYAGVEHTESQKISFRRRYWLPSGRRTESRTLLSKAGWWAS